ncbi:MAG: cell division protein FtsW [Oscillospiraceae bacterium]|nr:cell division protein FtsW [Oscillospiraceae bacterium]
MQQVRQNPAVQQMSQQPQRNAPARRSAPPQNKSSKKKKDPNRVRFWSFEGRADVPMLVITLVLLAFGITMMFSAGHAWAYQKEGNSFHYIMRQLPAAGLGLVGMFLLTFFDYRFLRHEFTFGRGKWHFTLAHIILIAMMFLNFLCLPFGIAATQGGQKRWLPAPIVGSFQPSDLLKVAVIVFLAYYIHKNSDQIRRFWVGLVKPGMLFLAIVAIMVGIQWHISGTLIIFLIGAVMLFVGGVNVKPAVLMLLLAVGIMLVAIQLSGINYFEERFAAMDPLYDPGDTTYQNNQAAMAIGSGGIWGKGFGNSSQKYYYLPEAQNDFVYAILVEEFGLIGGLIVIILFLFFIFRGFQIARSAEDKFGCLLATGITFQIGLQALLNIAVNLSAVPNTGVSLPFFSYGGTALMIQLWEMGLMMSVSKRAKLK